MAHQHSGQQQHDHHSPPKKSLHKDWRVWAIVLLILAAMGIYVATNDESVAPGVAPAPQVPAAQ